MLTPKHISDFPPESTKWVQTDKGAIAVVLQKDDLYPQVFFLHNGKIEELKPVP